VSTLIGHPETQREECKMMRKLLENNKICSAVLQNRMNEFGTRMERMNETTKIIKEEQEKINKWEVKEKDLEKELNCVDYWHRKNNMINLGVDEYPHESYSVTLI
jgi:predicted Rossmann fold nucleotide-binding protein DprA/Smf involved in DNA uptake